MRSMFFENNIDDDKYQGVLFGLGQNLKQPTAAERKKQKSGDSF